MSDLVAGSAITGVFVLAAAVIPVLISGRRQMKQAASIAAEARDAAVAAREHTRALIGEPNGRGDVTTMLTTILEWQEAHEVDDTERMAQIEAQVAALSVYSHTRFHDVLNSLTVVGGRTSLMWERFLEEQEKKT